MRFSTLSGSLLAALALSGCAGSTPLLVRDLPPEVLLQDCPEPPANIRTNKDLAEWALALRQALRVCNNDKAALREWATGD